MRTKFFAEGTEQKLEQKVNEWLMDNKDVELLFRPSYSCSISNNSGTVESIYSVAIWFDDEPVFKCAYCNETDVSKRAMTRWAHEDGDCCEGCLSDRIMSDERTAEQITEEQEKREWLRKDPFRSSFDWPAEKERRRVAAMQKEGE